MRLDSALPVTPDNRHINYHPAHAGKESVPDQTDEYGEWRLYPPPSGDTIRTAIGEAVAGYRHVFGDRLAQVWLFGSRATGKHRPYSDVDLLAVLHEESPSVLDDLNLLFSVEEPIHRVHKVHIDGHPTTLRKLETGDDDYHYFIRREGQRVDV